MSERRQEEEYFDRIEREKKQKLKATIEQETLTTQQQLERELHWHKCGKCGATMDTKLYRGVEVEMCPRCGAVLLDHGELQKLAGHDGSGIIAGIRAMFSGRSEGD